MKPKIKVCYLIGSLKFGGAERHLTKLLQHLDYSSVEPVVALFQKKGDFLPFVMSLNVPIYEINLNKLISIKMFVSLFRFRTFLIKNNIDIIHSFLWQANFFGAIAGFISKKHTIISKRNMNDWMSRRYLLINNIANFLCNHITAVSKNVMLSAISREKINPKKISVVQNGVDLPIQKNSELIFETKKSIGITDDSIIIGTVASLAERKGHYHLFQSIKTIISEYDKVKFVIIGDGILKDYLKNLSVELGIANNIIFLGYRHDVPQLLDCLDIFVLPSLEEGMSNALLEAMSHGLPIVATDVGGNAENVNNGVNGFIIPPKDPLSLSTALSKLIHDKSLRHSFGKRSRILIENNYNMSTVVYKNLQIYKRIIEDFS